MSEWFKEPVLKTGDSARGRGFESHPLRGKNINSQFESNYGEIPKLVEGARLESG